MVDKDELKLKHKEDLAELFTDLSKNQAPILVEGKRDREALIQGGIDAQRITMLHGKSRLDVEDLFADCKEVILLLDYDAEGLKILDEFKAIFSRAGTRVNTWYWSKIREIFSGHIDCIENIRGYFD
jgi:5S rRNA maturation endonuclease (ribonuclease M5)